MLRVTATEARRRFFDLLDAVERGEAVSFDRRGVEFRIETVAKPKRRKRHEPLGEVLDPRLLELGWTWEPGPDGQLQLIVGPQRLRPER
jgi:antitoxin (DNA-binding transcriptional repressor) of toxin-antitoxin stability system